jgi:hypothetical protein
MHIVEGSGNAEVTVYLRQKLYAAPQFANSNHVELTFMDSLWNEYTVTAEFSGQSGSDVFTVPFKPTVVIVDKNEKTADAIVSYNKIIKSPGTTLLNDAYVDLMVTTIQDSMYFRAEHHKVAPDPVVSNPDIYRISDSRYWKITGLIPENAEYYLKFDYNRTGVFFDLGLAPTIASVDSLILVYRPGPGHDWQLFPFTISGNAYAGLMTTSFAYPGEYALAIGEPNQSGLQESESQQSLKLFPNPASDKLQIGNMNEECVAISVTDMSGKVIYRESKSPEQNNLVINTSHFSNGEYLILELDSAGCCLSHAKLTIVR